MIDHSGCDHPSTSGARAKCRRAHAGGPTPTKRATPRVVGDEPEDNYGQTPRDRHMECDKCGVEKIAYKGTDFLTGILLYVGAKCKWYIKDAPDLQALD